MKTKKQVSAEESSDLATAHPNVDTSHPQHQTEDEASVEGISDTSNATDLESRPTSAQSLHTSVSNDVFQRADEIARWFEEQTQVDNLNLDESTEESNPSSSINAQKEITFDNSATDVTPKSHTDQEENPTDGTSEIANSHNLHSNAFSEIDDKTVSDSPIVSIEDEAIENEFDEIDEGLSDLNFNESDDFLQLLAETLDNFETESTTEDNTYQEAEDIGQWFQEHTQEKTLLHRDTQNDFSPFLGTDLDDEFKDIHTLSTQRRYSRIAVDTYQMWLRQIQRIQPSVKTTDNQISTKRLSATQETELFGNSELIKQEIESLLDQFPLAVLKGLSAKKVQGDGLKQQSRNELLLSVINTRKPLEQIRKAIDEMQAGHQSQEVAVLKQLWQDLSCSVERLQDIKDVIFQNNLRLVIHIASHCSSHDLETMDLIQEGYIGLMKAIDRFDVHKGYRFSTYATWWIRQAVWRAYDNHSRIIRFPSYIIEKRSAFLKSISELTQTLHKEPTRFEIAEALDCSVDEIDRFFNHPTNPIQLEQRIIPQTVAEYHAWRDTIGAEDDLQDEVQTWDASVEIELTRLRFLAELDEFTGIRRYRAEIASLLTPRERQDVEGHLGWNHTKPKPLLEIGIVLAILRERKRQRWLLKHEPSLEEIINAFDIPPGIVDQIQAIASEPFAFEQPIKSKTIVELVFALTQVCTQESLPDLLINESQISPEAILDSRLNTEVIEQVLNTLTPRETLVIKHRFGLINGAECTLAEIGQQLGGLSRERVRQIEERAFEKLRHPTRRKYLEELLNARF